MLRDKSQALASDGRNAHRHAIEVVVDFIELRKARHKGVPSLAILGDALPLCEPLRRLLLGSVERLQ